MYRHTKRREEEEEEALSLQAVRTDPGDDLPSISHSHVERLKDRKKEKKIERKRKKAGEAFSSRVERRQKRSYSLTLRCFELCERSRSEQTGEREIERKQDFQRACSLLTYSI